MGIGPDIEYVESGDMFPSREHWDAKNNRFIDKGHGLACNYCNEGKTKDMETELSRDKHFRHSMKLHNEMIDRNANG